MDCFFFDIDGTLCPPGQKIAPETVKQLHRVQQMGHKIFLATGRNLATIPDFLLSMGFDGIIASAGAYVQIGDAVLENQVLTEAQVARLQQVLTEAGMNYFIETDTATYADIPGHIAMLESHYHTVYHDWAYHRAQILRKLTVSPFSDFSHQGVYKICFVGQDSSTVAWVKEQLDEEFSCVLEPISNADSISGEISRKGISKGTGIRRICEQLGCTKSIAFGDSINDVEMLQAATVAIVMDNAEPVVKQYADVVCGACDALGVAKQLESMLPESFV